MEREALAQKRRAVNDQMRELAYGSSDEPIAFLCECGERSCFRTVWLPPAVFDRTRAAAMPVAAEHAPALRRRPPLSVRSSEQRPSGPGPMAVARSLTRLRGR